MSFLWPSMLYLLLLLPLLIAAYLYLQRRRRKVLETYGQLGLIQGDPRSRPGARRHIPPTLFLLSLITVTFALARPQAPVSLPRVEGTVMLVFDVSGSMAAEDLRPNRLEAAKAAAREFVKRQPPGVEIGIVAFSDGGLPVLAPTNDQATIMASIDRLSPQRGTSVANGILSALEAIVQTDEDRTALTESRTPTPEQYSKYSSAELVLLTDGENNMSPDPLEIAQTAADFGVRIHTIGIGSKEGIDLKVDNFIVHTQLDEATLQNISELTGGTYFNAQNEADLRTIYDSIEPQLVIKTEKMEVTSLFAGAGVLMLLIGGALSLLWFGRMP